MSERPNTVSPRVWIAVLGVLGSLAVGAVTLLLGLLSIGGVLMTYGGWKSQVDLRMTTLETVSKEQIVALSASTDKQILAVQAAAKEMIAALERSTDKRLTDIETDRRSKLDEFARYRSINDTKEATMETLLTNQQKQIDYLAEISGSHRTIKP